MQLINANYCVLLLISRLCGCLAAGGYLLCEEPLVTDMKVIGPGSVNYRVAPGDLAEAVSGVDVLMCQESIEMNAEGEQVASARLVVKKNKFKCN